MDLEIDTEVSNEKDLRRQRLKELYQLTHVLFTKPERLILYKILKDYNTRQDIERLIIGLNLILRTYTKLELLKYVRYFIWEGHVQEFDRLTKFHLRFRKRQNHPKSQTCSLLQVPEACERGSMSSVSTRGPKIKDVRVFTLVKEGGESRVGFSIRGGSEHGLGIYISDIDQDSAAQKCGLEVGDKILEANNISLKGVASSSAVKVLTSFSRVKLVIQRTRKVPEWRLSREKTSWVDVHDGRLISGEFEECGITHHIRGLETDDPERRVSLKFGKADRKVGFNVRGGREYGLGIYVSRVDKNGVADKNGVRVGDQIIDVNGIPFDNITHTNAVEVLKGKRHLILTLKDVGRFPAFKQLYAEYTWSDTHIRSASSMVGIQTIHMEEKDRQKSQSVGNLFYKDRRISVLQSEIFLPHDAFPSTSSGIQGGGCDDLDSLSDLEHWSHSIQPRHINTGGAMDGVQVSVHVNEAGNISDTELGKETEQNVVTRDDAPETSDQSDDIIHEDNSDDAGHVHAPVTDHDVYAQINKRSVGDEAVVAEDGTGGIVSENQSVQGYFNGGQENNEDAIEHSLNGGTEKSFITQQYSEFSLHEKRYETQPEALTNSNENIVKQTSVGGGLYSKVKAIGRPSVKGNTGDQQPDTIGTTPSSPVQSTVSDESWGHSAPTLQVRPLHGLDSDEESDSSLHEGQSQTYVFNMEKGNGYESDNKSYKGKEKKGSYTINDGALHEESLEGRLRELECRQTNIGLQQLSSLSPSHNEADGSVSSRKSTWKAFKSKIKGSLRLKTPRRHEMILPAEKDQTKGEDITIRRGLRSVAPNAIDDYNMATFEDAASKILNAQEYAHIMKQVKMYHESHNLERLVEMLLSTLNSPEKILLLRDVRGIIYPLDIVRFDNRVNTYEIEAYQTLSMKLHLPLNHKQLKRPRKTIITTEIGKRRYKRKSVSFAKNPSRIPDAGVSLECGEAEDGHFHIRPLDQLEKSEDIVNSMQHQLEDRRGKGVSRSYSQDPNHISEQFAYLDQLNTDFGMDSLSEYSSFGSGEYETYSGSTVVHLSKNKQTIGLELYETDTSGQREVRIQRIDSHGAAHDDNDIQEGMVILAIDRHKVEGSSKEEVMALLQKCFADKQRVSMKLVLRHVPPTDHAMDQSTDL